ncbi:hypothetical protein [Actinospica sp.]|jgi:hypothetical protein|uniref:hypothetical protein n=1 Tax=Actinospica sp. TaxID=1872142 RepID=UPI002C9F1D9A|nr:hypothetical protein [Actinospica sp.]HWG23420.1 hypothetical protein [Actinospica sp.]
MVFSHAPHRKKVYDPEAHPELDHNRPDPRAWLTPLLGVVFVALVAVSAGLNWSMPDHNASNASIINYYAAHSGRVKTSAIMGAIAVPAGLFFFGLLREHLSASRAARPFAVIALAGAVVFAVGGAMSAGLSFTLADVPTKLSGGAAQALNVLNSDLIVGLFIGGLATMQLAFGVAFLVSKAFPTWLGWLTVVIGVVSLLGPLFFFGLIATGVWILIVSALIYPKLRDRGKPPAAEAMPMV